MEAQLLMRRPLQYERVKHGPEKKQKQNKKQATTTTENKTIEEGKSHDSSEPWTRSVPRKLRKAHTIPPSKRQMSAFSRKTHVIRLFIFPMS